MPSTHLHFERAGQGETIVFLHGFMGASSDWLPVSSALQHEFDCIRVDLPAHGRSPLPLHQTPNLAWMSAQLTHLLEKLELTTVHLVGYSMGARVALYHALNHPEHLRSLTIESGAPGLADPDQRTARTRLDQERAHNLRTHGLQQFLTQWYAAPLFESLAKHPDFPRILEQRTAGNAHELAHVLEHISPGKQPDLTPLLTHLKVPSLWIAGELDNKYVQILTRAASQTPSATLAIIKNAGHNTHFEQPQQFTSVLTTFLHALKSPVP